MTLNRESNDLLNIREALLDAFNTELRYLRDGVQEFVDRWPDVAPKLKLDASGQSDDPTVERLIEAVAFQTARIQLRLTEERARVPHVLLELLYPEIVAPFPSCSIAKFAFDRDRTVPRDGVLVPRGSEIVATTRVERTACRFRTSFAVRLWPLEVTSVAVESPRRLVVRFTNMSRTTTLSALHIDSVRLYVSGEGLAGTIYERIVMGRATVGVRVAGGAEEKAPQARVRPVGFRWPAEALIDPSPRTSPGLLTLFEYLHFPAKFSFIDIEGLSPLRTLLGDDRRLASWDLLLDLESTEGLVDRVDANSLQMGCTPVVNVFSGRTDPRKLLGREPDVPVLASAPAEMRVDAESVLAPYHSEVYRVDRVEVSRPGSGPERYEPFLQFHEASATTGLPGFWHAERRPTALRGSSSAAATTSSADGNIPGTDVLLTVTDLGETPFSVDRTLNVWGLFTNRHLARRLRRGEKLELAAGSTDGIAAGPLPVERVLLAADVTETRHPRLDSEALWRLVSLLSLSYLPLDDVPAADGPSAPLKTLLDIQNFGDSAAVRQRIGAIRSVRTRQRTRRVWWPDDDATASEARWVGIDPAPPRALIGLVRGTEITVVLEDRSRTGELADSLLLFGSVLDHYFRTLAGVNGFTETIVHVQRSDGSTHLLNAWEPAFGFAPAL